MRILHVYFAPPEEGPARTGGIAGYVRNLATALRDLGHEVGVLGAGSVFTPDADRTCAGVCKCVRLEPWEGIDRLVIENSPFLAPALWQYGESWKETRAPELERIFEDAVRAWRADVLHVHSLEGLSAGCIEAARRAGARVFMSLHNHHPFCPQVYLMRGRRLPCIDYEGGLACATCEQSIDVELERKRRAGVVDGPGPHIEPPSMPPILRFSEDGSPTPESARVLSGQHPLWQPLENEPPPSELAHVVNNAFGERRAAMVKALNACDRVLAVSTFVGRLAHAMGVNEERIEVQPIGTMKADAVTVPARAPADDLRLIFLGFNNYYKGLPMLVDAIACLPVPLRSRVHLAAFGPGCQGIRERAEAIRPRLAGLELGGAYEPGAIGSLLEGRHVGVVPSVWWDNGPQTLMEFQARGLPVLGARLGGIPDRVRCGENGLLFRGNDRRDAARQIERLLTEPWLFQQIRRGAQEVRSLALTTEHHAREVADLYAGTLQSPPRPSGVGA